MDGTIFPFYRRGNKRHQSQRIFLQGWTKCLETRGGRWSVANEILELRRDNYEDNLARIKLA